MIYYFSGTGNSRRVALRLSEALNEPLGLMTEAPRPTDNDRLTGFVFPVYAWGLPKVVADFLAQMPRPRTGNGYTFGIMTCGDDTGYTNSFLRRALRRNGRKLDAVFSLQMRNTYVALPGFDIDPPTLAEAKETAAFARLDKEILPRIATREQGVCDVVRGALPFTKSYLLRPLFNAFLTGDGAFRSSSACTGCGRCVRVCPLGNIRLGLASKRPHWQGRCTDCHACYHACPQHAIGRGYATKGKGQVTVDNGAAEK